LIEMFRAMLIVYTNMYMFQASPSKNTECPHE
jgi:hypothetical protein